MAAEVCGEVVRVPLRDAWGRRRAFPEQLMTLVRDLA
jgi:hypothetical protein